MTFKKGDPRPAGAGRPPGRQNKTTRVFLEALTAVLEEPETESALRSLRDSDEAMDRSTFWRIAGNRVPKMVEAKVEGLVTIDLIDLSGERRDGEAS